MSLIPGTDTSTPDSPSKGTVRAGFVRQVLESVIVLTIAVLSFRAFVAEGYMISTGSMAPFLLGYHKQVECPACHLTFATGVPVADDKETGNPGATSQARAQDLQGEPDEPIGSTCPNCGHSHINLDPIPRNEGDQLMVHKHAYQLRDPRRWEVIVFKNPSDPEQAYVKRVVGLPGERIVIEDGDILINDQPQPRSLETLRGMRILVDDHDHQPVAEDPNWQPRWIVTRTDSRWHAEGNRFDIQAGAERAETDTFLNLRPDYDWLNFRHWIREGGQHVTSVPLSRWPAAAGFPPATGPLVYNSQTRMLSATGVIPDAMVREWEARCPEPHFVRTLQSLAAASHEAPITDEYGYNRPRPGETPFVVRDLMVSFKLKPGDVPGVFAVTIDDGRTRSLLELDFIRQLVRLRDDSSYELLHEALMPELTGKSLEVEMALMDRHVYVALNGQSPFPVTLTSSEASPRPTPLRPIALGAASGSFVVNHLKIFRDVYYTPKTENRLDRQLKDDQFFVLGDNSPISVDSRHIDTPTIERSHLIGKPLVVHLPSQQGKIDLLGETRFVRIPDFSRVRYIR